VQKGLGNIKTEKFGRTNDRWKYVY
jgi:hypothetical protein